MPLADEITALRDQILTDLDTVHNYYTHTMTAWRAVQQFLSSGGTVEFENRHTGDTLSPEDLPRTAHIYIGKHLAPMTFQQFVSLFDDFILGFLRRWLSYFPKTLEGKKVDAAAVFAASTLDELRQQIVDRHILDLAYGRLSDALGNLKTLVNIKHPIKEEIARLTEIKASRDVLQHNRGVANAIYVEKAGARQRFADGEQLEIDEPYHLASWQLIRKVVSDISADALAKLRKLK
jgi:hypothetical protein